MKIFAIHLLYKNNKFCYTFAIQRKNFAIHLLYKIKFFAIHLLYKIINFAIHLLYKEKILLYICYTNVKFCYPLAIQIIDSNKKILLIINTKKIS